MFFNTHDSLSAVIFQELKTMFQDLLTASLEMLSKQVFCHTVATKIASTTTNYKFNGRNVPRIEKHFPGTFDCVTRSIIKESAFSYDNFPVKFVPMFQEFSSIGLQFLSKIQNLNFPSHALQL